MNDQNVTPDPFDGGCPADCCDSPEAGRTDAPSLSQPNTLLVELARLAVNRQRHYTGKWYHTPERPGTNGTDDEWAKYAQALRATEARDKARGAACEAFSTFIRDNFAALAAACGEKP